MSKYNNATIEKMKKMSRAEKEKYIASLEYKRQYHAKKKAERQATLTGQKVRNARQNGRQEGIAVALARVETLIAERNGLKVKEAEIIAELESLLSK